MKHLARFDDGLAAAWAWAERFRVPRPRLHMVLPDGEPRVGRDAHGEVAELRFDPCSVHLSVFDFREALLYLVKLAFRDGAGDILLLDSSLTPPQSCRKTHILRQFMTPAPSPLILSSQYQAMPLPALAWTHPHRHNKAKGHAFRPVSSP